MVVGIPITPANTGVWEAVMLSRYSRGETGRWYKTVVRQCGTFVASNTWALGVTFASPIVTNSTYIAFLTDTASGWRLYYYLPASPLH